MRWDLIGNFEVLKKGRYAVATKYFSGSEDFFEDHFPGKPLVPQTLMMEMIAQAGGVLFGFGFDFNKEVILAKISEAKFTREVAAPCDFLIRAELEEEREEGAWIFGRVSAIKALADRSVASETVAEMRMLLVTFDSLEGGPGKRIVFNNGFLEHYNIYGVAKASEDKT